MTLKLDSGDMSYQVREALRAKLITLVILVCNPMHGYPYIKGQGGRRVPERFSGAPRPIIDLNVIFWVG